MHPEAAALDARIEFRLPQVPLQVHGAQSAVTAKVMDELVSYGVSRATVTLTLTRTPTRTRTQPGEPWRLELRAPDGMTTCGSTPTTELRFQVNDLPLPKRS